MTTLMLALILAGQSLAPFAGTWTAAVKGQTYVRLELSESRGALSGRISLGAMHVDKDGVFDTVQQPATNFTPIFDVVARGDAVAFARKDDDDTDRFEIRMVDGDVQLTFVLSAELRERFAREGVPLPKPVRLVKTP